MTWTNNWRTWRNCPCICHTDTAQGSVGLPAQPAVHILIPLQKSNESVSQPVVPMDSHTSLDLAAFGSYALVLLYLSFSLMSLVPTAQPSGERNQYIHANTRPNRFIRTGRLDRSNTHLLALCELHLLCCQLMCVLRAELFKLNLLLNQNTTVSSQHFLHIESHLQEGTNSINCVRQGRFTYQSIRLELYFVRFGILLHLS